MGDGENKYIYVKSPVFLLVRQKGWGSFLESEGFVRRPYLGCPMQAPSPACTQHRLCYSFILLFLYSFILYSNLYL